MNPPYKIFETNEFLKSLDKLDKHIQKSLYNIIKSKVYKQIEQEPHYGLNIKKLKNYKPDTWRYKIGHYRLFYEIEEEIRIIDIVSIKHRQKAYQ